MEMINQLIGNYIPDRLIGPVLVDRHGIPRYWSTVWSTMHAGQLADSTHKKKLYFISGLYQHAEEMYGPGALDDSIADLDEDKLAVLLESWFVSISNRTGRTDSDEARWQTGLDFVITIATWIAKNDTNSHLQNIEKRLNRLSLLYKQLHISKSRGIESIRSLPAVVVSALYELLDPESATNPFPRLATRWRIYVAFILMLHQGLRRGELLLLSTDAIKSAFDTKTNRHRYWINVSESTYGVASDDSRSSRPSIKTKDSIRQIPVSAATAGIVETYAMNFRGKTPHSYLLSSQSNRPLSSEALTKAFVVISRAIPSDVMSHLTDRTGKTSITPHDLRHTCAVWRLSQLLQHGDSMDESLQKMRSFFGWSRESSMPSRYAKAVFEDRYLTYGTTLSTIV